MSQILREEFAAPGAGQEAAFQEVEQSEGAGGVAPYRSYAGIWVTP